MKKVTGAAILLAVSLFYIFPVNAADRVLRVHTFELDDIDEIEINNSIGSIDLRLVEGNEMRVEVDIESEGRFFRRGVDVDDIEVGVRMRGDKLTLTIDEDNIKADWYIELPAVSNIDIDMGVGEIDVEIGASELDIDLGVGEIDVIAPLASTGDIELSAGVGDTTILGASSSESSRSVVSSESEGNGEGELYIEAEVGVGDVTVELL
jgi:hypothetical protein